MRAGIRVESAATKERTDLPEKEHATRVRAAFDDSCRDVLRFKADDEVGRCEPRGLKRLGTMLRQVDAMKPARFDRLLQCRCGLDA